jgi:hypothetical protein
MNHEKETWWEIVQNKKTTYLPTKYRDALIDLIKKLKPEQTITITKATTWYRVESNNYCSFPDRIIYDWDEALKIARKLVENGDTEVEIWSHGMPHGRFWSLCYTPDDDFTDYVF